MRNIVVASSLCFFVYDAKLRLKLLSHNYIYYFFHFRLFLALFTHNLYNKSIIFHHIDTFFTF